MSSEEKKKFCPAKIAELFEKYPNIKPHRRLYLEGTPESGQACALGIMAFDESISAGMSLPLKKINVWVILEKAGYDQDVMTGIVTGFDGYSAHSLESLKNQVADQKIRRGVEIGYETARLVFGEKGR